jgi:hypothetical protein
VRVRDQFKNRQADRTYDAAERAGKGGSGDSMTEQSAIRNRKWVGSAERPGESGQSHEMTVSSKQ